MQDKNRRSADRGVVITTNHRNTFEIVELADSLVAGDEFVGIEGAISVEDASQEILRHGPEDCALRYNHPARQIARRPHSGRQGDGHGLRRCGCARTRQLAGCSNGQGAARGRHPDRRANKVRRSSGRCGESRNRSPGEGARVQANPDGRTPRALLESAPAADDASSERKGLDRRALYVAITRARDGLWVEVS
jgi:hypothetical protein